MYDTLIAEMREHVEREVSEKLERLLKALADPSVYPLLSDPDLAPYISRLHWYVPRLSQMVQPERRIKSKLVPANGELVYAITAESAVGFKSGNGLREAILSLSLPERFTSEDVCAQLEAKHFPFAGKDPKKSVGDALYGMATRSKNPTLVIVEKGIGGKPNVYARVDGVEH